jgi:putative RNA 2'-phosphotransferase
MSLKEVAMSRNHNAAIAADTLEILKRGFYHNPDQQKRISKRLSLHLRHQPEGLSLEIQEGGWVDVDKLIQAFSKVHFPITRAELEEVVQGNDKQRFAFNESGTLIRASQGHSVVVELQLQPQTPPEILYHGTNPSAVQTLLKEGLKKMSRHHVHLSPDKETATKVGSRRGKPVLLKVRAGEMHRAGHVFYCSANGVWLANRAWLADEVPAQWIEVL